MQDSERMRSANAGQGSPSGGEEGGQGRMGMGGMGGGMGRMGDKGGGMGGMRMMGRMRGMRGRMGGMGMGGMGMGMCPMCGRSMGVGADPEEEQGPHRGKGPAKRTDDQIRSEAEQALTEDSWLDATGVQVSVQNGVVNLTGTVDSREAKRRAEDLVDELSGARDVQNNLRIA